LGVALVPSLFQLFNVGLLDIAVGTPLEIRVQSVQIVHDHFARLEARHPFLESTVGHGLDEVLLAQRLEALDERWSDETLLIRSMAAIAGAGAPGTKSVHRIGIDLHAIDDLVGFVSARRCALVLRKGWH